jgi:hypothetical protein
MLESLPTFYSTGQYASYGYHDSRISIIALVSLSIELRLSYKLPLPTAGTLKYDFRMASVYTFGRRFVKIRQAILELKKC